MVGLLVLASLGVVIVASVAVIWVVLRRMSR